VHCWKRELSAVVRVRSCNISVTEFSSDDIFRPRLSVVSPSSRRLLSTVVMTMVRLPDLYCLCGIRRSADATYTPGVSFTVRYRSFLTLFAYCFAIAPARSDRRTSDAGFPTPSNPSFSRSNRKTNPDVVERFWMRWPRGIYRRQYEIRESSTCSCILLRNTIFFW